MLRLLRRPRWIAFTLLAVLACVAFVELGLWQLRRHDERAAFNSAVQAGATSRPAPLGRVLTVGRDPRPADEWRAVRASGRYDPARTLLVRNRTQSGRVGFWVLTPLVTPRGTCLLVNRGWVQAGATARAVPEVPPTATGQVALTGRLRLPEKADDPVFQAPRGQVTAVDVDRIAARLPYPAYGGYVELVNQQPAPPGGLERLPPPELTAGPHLAYAVQWFLFVAVAGVGWWVLLRREAVEQNRSGRSNPAVHQPSVPDPARSGSR